VLGAALVAAARGAGDEAVCLGRLELARGGMVGEVEGQLIEDELVRGKVEAADE
jgi:hypothetical protein